MPPTLPAQRTRKGAETATVRAILQYLWFKQIPAWRMNSGAFRGEYKGTTRFHRFGVKGMADIVGIAPYGHDGPMGFRVGRFLAIEVKSAAGKPTVEQTAFLAAVVRAGGIAFIARSVRDVQEHGL